MPLGEGVGFLGGGLLFGWVFFDRKEQGKKIPLCEGIPAISGLELGTRLL